MTNPLVKNGQEVVTRAAIVNWIDLSIMVLRGRGAEEEASALLVLRQVIAGEPA